MSAPDAAQADSSTTGPTAGPIGVFDSGLGGLTVLRSLIDLLPDEPVVYFGDTGRFPYGPKPAEEVRGYALEIGDLLVARGARLLVVACNSAAAAALDCLRDRLPVPVVGVVAVYSATYFRMEDFWRTQIVWAVVGLAVFIITSLIHYRFIKWIGVPMYLGATGMIIHSLISLRDWHSQPSFLG